jgi:PLP dependent protein
METTIQKNLALVKSQIIASALKYQRDPAQIHLVAVSKTHTLEQILEAYNVGQCAFAENYLQQALPKIMASLDKNFEWHFIGLIQQNKTKKIAEYFHWVHSICNFKIAQRLSAQRPAQLSPLNICLQVKIDAYSNSGVAITELNSLVKACSNLPNLRLRGLMVIPKANASLEQQHLCFQKLRECFKNLIAQGYNLDTLSMGMSDDMDIAIAEGSTLLRIGTAIFGKR